MHGLFTLVWREWRGSFKALRILIICMIISVALLGAIGQLRHMVNAAIDEQSYALLGGDLVLLRTYSGPDAQESAVIHSIATTSTSIELRSMMRSQNTSRLVELKTIDTAYPHYGTLSLDGMPTTALLSGMNIAVEPSLLEWTGWQIGQTVTLGDATLTIAATIAQEPDRITTAFRFGPRVLLSHEALQASNMIGFGTLSQHRVRLKLKDGVSIEQAKERLQSITTANSGWRMLELKDAARGLSRFIDRLARFLSLASMTAILIAGVGVASAAGSFLKARATRMAIYRSLGYTATQVTSIYALVLAGITIITCLIGSILGVAVPLILRPVLEPLINLPLPFAIGWLDAVLSCLIGLMATMLFALWPLYRTSHTPPSRLFRAADPDGIAAPKPTGNVISLFCFALMMLLSLSMLFSRSADLTAYYAIGAALALAALHFTAKLIRFFATHASSSLPLSLRYGLAQMRRPGTSTAFILLAMGLGLAVMVMTAIIEQHIRAQIDDELPQNAPAFFMMDVSPDIKDALTQSLNSIDGTQDFITSPMLAARFTHVNDTPAAQMLAANSGSAWVIRGDRRVSFADKQPTHTPLTKGTWWNDGTSEAFVSVSQDIADAFSLKLGDTLHFAVQGQEITASIANFRDIDWSSYRMNFVFIFSKEALKDQPYQYLATLRASKNAEINVIQTMHKNYPNVSVIPVRETLHMLTSVMEHIATVIRIITIALLALGVIVTAAAITTSMHSRRQSYAILQMVGASKSQLLAMVLAEFALIGFAASALAIAIGMVSAHNLLEYILNIKPTMHFTLPIQVACAGVITMLIIGLFTTRQSLKIRPLNQLRNQ